jgi:DNA-binding response OmpR family regulator
MKRRILIVDDDADVRFSIVDGLGMVAPDWEIVEAPDGNHALGMLTKDYVDLIILDVMMPGMDGIELSSKIKENPSLAHIPIIFLSAKTDEYSKALGQMNAAEYLEKPFEINDLKSKLDEYLG